MATPYQKGNLIFAGIADVKPVCLLAAIKLNTARVRMITIVIHSSALNNCCRLLIHSIDITARRTKINSDKIQPAANAKPAPVPFETDTYVVIRFKGPNGSEPKKLISNPQLNIFINGCIVNCICVLCCCLLNMLTEKSITFYHTAHKLPQ